MQKIQCSKVLERSLGRLDIPEAESEAGLVQFSVGMWGWGRLPGEPTRGARGVAWDRGW